MSDRNTFRFNIHSIEFHSYVGKLCAVKLGLLVSENIRICRWDIIWRPSLKLLFFSAAFVLYRINVFVLLIRLFRARKWVALSKFTQYFRIYYCRSYITRVNEYIFKNFWRDENKIRNDTLALNYITITKWLPICMNFWNISYLIFLHKNRMILYVRIQVP